MPHKARVTSPKSARQSEAAGSGPELQQIVEALQESEERYRSIVSAMFEGIVLQNADGQIIECNAAAERIIGLSRDEMLGRTSRDPRWRSTDADGRPSHPESHPITVTLRTGQPLRDVVMGFHKPDGTRVWTRINTQALFRPGEVRPYAAVASFEDITESRRARAELLESELRYRALFEHSVDGALLTAPDGSIFAANPEACRLLGRSEEEICRLGRAGVVDTTDPRLEQLLAERQRTGKGRGELTMIRADGAKFPAEVSSGLFVDRHGNMRTSLTFRDISERKKAQAARDEANARLEERVAERTRELTALLEIGREVASQLELQPLLDEILDHLKTVIDYDGAGIAILEQDELVIVDYVGPLPREKTVGVRVPLDRDSGYRRVVELRAPVIVDDIWAEVKIPGSGWPIWDENMQQDIGYVRSWLGAPLLAKGKLIGVLRVDHAEPGRFNERDEERALAFAYHAAVAIVNAQLHEAAQVAAVTTERERLARELHDSVSQALYGISLGVHAARSSLSQEQEQAQKALSFVLQLAQTGLAEMRALIFELRPDSLETDGLITALARHVAVLRARHGLSIITSLPEEPHLPLDAKEALYRIAQEAANNAVQHSSANTLGIRLNCESDVVILEVTDDGDGFDASRFYPGHMGLRNMRERAANVGAICHIDSVIGRGTKVTVRVPVPERPSCTPPASS